MQSHYSSGKYLNNEVRQEDIVIPKIDIADQNSCYDVNKSNKSFLSAVVNQDYRDGLNSMHRFQNFQSMKLL